MHGLGIQKAALLDISMHDTHIKGKEKAFLEESPRVGQFDVIPKITEFQLRPVIAFHIIVQSYS